jgi:hypothetical protein
LNGNLHRKSNATGCGLTKMRRDDAEVDWARILHLRSALKAQRFDAQLQSGIARESTLCILAQV